jgi:hypothetical protein
MTLRYALHSRLHGRAPDVSKWDQLSVRLTAERVHTRGDMNYGADFIRIESRNQPARVFCGDGGEVYAPTRSLL